MVVLSSIFWLVPFGYAQMAPDLQVWLPMDGNAHDASGNNRQGTINGASLVEDRFGHPDSAFSFESGNTITVDSNMFEIEKSGEFSFCLWMNVDHNPTSISNVIRMSRDRTPFGISIMDNEATILTELRMEGADVQWWSPAGLIVLNQWCHVAMTFDGSTKRIYIDGELTDTVEAPGTLSVQNGPLLIGSDEEGFYGSVDDVRIYNRSLTPTEIQAIVDYDHLQKLNIPEEPIEDRFQITDKIWPQNYGDTDVCLWNDDQVAAVCISVDDNCAMDVDWWLHIDETYGWKVTWNLIAERIETGENPHRYGTWELWLALHEMGFGIASHTLTSAHCRFDCPYEDIYQCCDLDLEYGEARTLIRRRIPEAEIGTMAYNGGGHYEHDPEIAKKYYLSSRWVFGTPNQVNKTWYMHTNSHNWEHFEEDKIEYQRRVIDNILNPNHDKFYRGWLSIHVHCLRDKTAQLEQSLQYVFDHREHLWLGRYEDIIKYGQQRDTHQLTNLQIEQNQIRFEVTDQMMDLYYDFPLTVKVRLDDTWSENRMIVTQDEKPIEFRLIQHEGQIFALVKAIPDQGIVTISKIQDLTEIGEWVHHESQSYK